MRSGALWCTIQYCGVLHRLNHLAQAIMLTVKCAAVPLAKGLQFRFMHLDNDAG